MNLTFRANKSYAFICIQIGIKLKKSIFTVYDLFDHSQQMF